MIPSNKRKNPVSEAKTSYFVGWMKIIICHFQLMTLIKQINFSWNSFSTYYLYIQNYLGNSSETINSFDCLIVKSIFIKNE